MKSSTKIFTINKTTWFISLPRLPDTIRMGIRTRLILGTHWKEIFASLALGTALEYELDSIDYTLLRDLLLDAAALCHPVTPSFVTVKDYMLTGLHAVAEITREYLEEEELFFSHTEQTIMQEMRTISIPKGVEALALMLDVITSGHASYTSLVYGNIGVREFFSLLFMARYTNPLTPLK